MTAKVIKVLLVIRVFATFTSLASGALGEANGCVVNPASGGTEQVQSCSDSTSLLQAQIRTHATGGGQTSQSSSRKYIAEERNAREEVAGKEEAEDEGKDDELEEDEEQVAKRWKGKLTVTVVKATGVIDEDWSGKSDPYVLVKVNCNKKNSITCQNKETKEVSDTANPTWNEELIFDDFKYSGLKSVCFKMYDADVGIDDWLGPHIPCANLDELWANGGEKTYNLTGGDGWDTLTVKLKWQDVWVPK